MGSLESFFSMARDGLLPAWAARVDARTRTPRSATLVTGVLVALASLIGDAAETYDLTNIGTLFAFALVCAGVLVLRVVEPERHRQLRYPGGEPLSARADTTVMHDCRAARHNV